MEGFALLLSEMYVSRVCPCRDSRLHADDVFCFQIGRQRLLYSAVAAAAAMATLCVAYLAARQKHLSFSARM